MFSIASAGQLADINERELQRQEERERQRQQEMRDAEPDVRLQPETAPMADLVYPEGETPCFAIREIRLEGERAEKFQWALRAVDDAVGRCLGAKGVNILMRRVQNRIVDAGYITTRVVAAPQDLNGGVLVLTLVPGTVSAVKLSEDSGGHILLGAVMPVRKGQILNLRNVEQGLENLRRVPTVQTDIKLMPGEREGESDLVVKRTQGRPVRVSLGIDDSGSKYTGKYQGNATLYLDNVLGMSDLFYANINRDLEDNKPYGTNGYGFYYSIPYGYWQLALNSNYYKYHQMVAGYDTDYEYSGRSRNSSVELSRTVLRTSKGKTSLTVAAFLNTSNNFIDDTELEIQRRRLAGWELGISHRQFIGRATLDADLRYHRGTGAFSAMPAPEEEVDEGTSRPEILTAGLRLQAPFKLGGQEFRYYGQFRGQWAFTKLLQRDRFSIAGRYTVRGYDGEMTLSADNGYTFRNELGWVIPKIGQELYGAFDVGHVRGPFDDYLLGKTLSGAAVGLRGGIRNFSYDVFVSRPIAKPDRFPGDRWVGGFSATLQF